MTSAVVGTADGAATNEPSGFNVTVPHDAVPEPFKAVRVYPLALVTNCSTPGGGTLIWVAMLLVKLPAPATGAAPAQLASVHCVIVAVSVVDPFTTNENVPPQVVAVGLEGT